MLHARKPLRSFLATLTVSCLAVSAISLPSAAQGRLETLRIAGTLTHGFADSFASLEAHGHSEELTLVTSFGESISISDESGRLEAIASGEPVIVEVAVPAGTVPAALAGTDEFLNETEVGLLAESLDVPLVGVAVVDDSPTLSGEVLGHVTEPFNGLSSLRSTALGLGEHPTVIVLPIPSDYNGNLGGCTPGDAACLPPEPASWQSTNGPLTQARAQELISDASDYWSTQTFGRVSDFPVVEVVRQWVAETSDDLCSIGQTNATFNTWWQEFRQSSIFKNPSGHMMVFTGSCAGPVDGIASIGAGINSGGLVLLRNDNLSTLIHEIGHNFSLGHSNVPDGYDGHSANGEYFGLYSPMALTVTRHGGAAYPVPALDIAYQDYLGVLPAGQLVPVTDSGTRQLTATSSLTGTRGLRLATQNADSPLYAEYRSGTGSDEPTFYASSAILGNNLRFGSGIRLYTLTHDDVAAHLETLTHPHPNSPFQHLVLGSGHTYTNVTDGLGLTVDVASISGTGASLEVTYAVPNDEPSPGPTQEPTHEPTYEPTEDPAPPAVQQPSNPQPTPPTTNPTPPVAAKKATTARIVVNKGAYGKARKATVTLSGSPKPTGVATIYVNGKKRGTAALKSGKATFTLPKNLKAGKHTVKVTIPASARYRATTQSSSFTVPKLKGRVTGFSSGTKKVRIGKKYSKKFTVNASATLQRATGKKWATVKKLKKGSHTLTVSMKKSTKTARYRVVLKGTSQVTRAASKTLTLKPVNK